MKLDYLGEGWQECYLSFRPLTVREADLLFSLQGETDTSVIVRKSMELLKSKFVSGKMLSGGKVVDLISDDLVDLPIDMVTSCISLLNEAEKKTI